MQKRDFNITASDKRKIISLFAYKRIFMNEILYKIILSCNRAHHGKCTKEHCRNAAVVYVNL